MYHIPLSVTKSLMALALIMSACTSGKAVEPQPILLSDENFAPEGIAISPGGTLYTGSLKQGRIISIDLENNDLESDFIESGANGLVSVVGLHVSSHNDLLYTCSSDPGFSELTGTSPSALLAFNRVTGNAGGRYELPLMPGLCNDITELPGGTILVTDSIQPRIYALNPAENELEIWFEDSQFEGPGFNLNGIAYDAMSDSVYVVRFNTGTMHRIPVEAGGLAGTVSQVSLPNELNGPDGLTALGNGRFLLVEGGGLDINSKGNLLGIDLLSATPSVDILASGLEIPTTVAVFQNHGYVVEGQLDHLVNPDAGPASVYRIVPVELPQQYR